MGGQAGADQLINGPDDSIFGGCFVSGGTILTPPAPGTFGNMRRNVVYGPGFVNLDFSVIKDFKFGERLSLQLRGEFFNVLNHPNFADPDHDLSDGSAGTFGAGTVHARHCRLQPGDRLRRLAAYPGRRQDNLVERDVQSWPAPDIPGLFHFRVGLIRFFHRIFTAIAVLDY